MEQLLLRRNNPIIAVQDNWILLRPGLISLDFLVETDASQIQVHRGGAETAEEDALMIQSRETRDWIINSYPSGTKSDWIS